MSLTKEAISAILKVGGKEVKNLTGQMVAGYVCASESLVLDDAKNILDMENVAQRAIIEQLTASGRKPMALSLEDQFSLEHTFNLKIRTSDGQRSIINRVAVPQSELGFLGDCSWVVKDAKVAVWFVDNTPANVIPLSFGSPERGLTRTGQRENLPPVNTSKTKGEAMTV
jgi:hypothetical protein